MGKLPRRDSRGTNPPMKHLTILALLLVSSTACTFHSTAKRWNDRVGANGNPVYVKSTTNFGLNLGIILPLFGSTEIDSMVHDMTGEIADENGDRVRIIESAAENYWYGWPPFTWIITPVLTTVTADYEPSAEQRAADLKAAQEAAAEDN